MGPGEGVGDSGVEGGAAPGGVWEALAVTGEGRDTSEPPPCSPHGQELSGIQGQSEEGEFAADGRNPYTHCEFILSAWIEVGQALAELE